MATWSVGQRALLTCEDEALLNRLLDPAVIEATTFLPPPRPDGPRAPVRLAAGIGGRPR